MALFPRFQLFEIEDMPWCPSWLREYAHRALHQMWNTVGPGKTSSTAAQACDILVSKLPAEPSAYTFVDACAGAGGPTPMLERSLNSRLKALGGKKQPVRFLLADLYPDWEAWKKITAASENITHVKHPVDAATVERYVTDGTLECRLFNLCFHHFDDAQAVKILRSSVNHSDSFVIFEMTQRNLPALLNTSIVILSPLISTLLWFWWSPLHVVFTYLIPIVPLFFAWDGYVSCIRTRTGAEIRDIIAQEEARGGLDTRDWTFHYGQTKVLPPFGNLYWFIGVRNRKDV
ncbi:hypothetical protein B0T26DRAFT_831019 [Lasiosphaeria miniovina]|uniref:Uncharacterized protein n=1 Tax=Lasiosphaeria miniovina TaxID=1954250 RepID=A0AA40AMB0_9PEZI|nr:uncharacterized protein B0T26DRAFT_831019 [Lasiosphaeria miniovina]KAK0718481.1 hypothetical protein B0T26DRAFT_831019 [Lasiosphaeria miniovina]